MTLERSIREDFGEDVEVDTHIEPLEPELPAWHRRLTRTRGNHQGRAGAASPANGAIHDIHNVRVRDTDAGEIVNFHCRAAPSMSVIKVHENVDEIERALRRAFPPSSASSVTPNRRRDVVLAGAFPFRTHFDESLNSPLDKIYFALTNR